jgi:hypothetical protein
VVVPRGSLQLESGFTFAKGGGQKQFNAAELLLRWGVAERTELRLGVPDYFRTWGASRGSGFSDLFLGFKQQLGPDEGWGLALIAGASLPTGSGGFSSGRVDPEVLLAWARDLDQRNSLGGLVGFLFPTEDGERNETLFATVSLAHSLGSRWGTFFEWAAEFPNTGGDAHVFHHGYTYALTDESQLDFHVGIGLSRAAPDYLVGAGYSVRF